MAHEPAGAAMREVRVKKNKTVCTYCAVGCTFDVWTKDREILRVEPSEGPVNSISTCGQPSTGPL
jgi:formate dehydrogenase major subunit